MTRKAKILVVDDEPLNVKLCDATLSFEGYDIIKAYNGQQALKKVDEGHPDLIILDIMMPDIDGIEVTRRLKADAETKDIPIILITASDDSNYKIIGYEAGADEFLNKPILPIELTSRVRSLIDTKKYKDKAAHQPPAKSEKSDDNDVSSVLLVIEDEDHAKLIKTYLHGQPYQLVTEKTAEKAVALCNQRQVDLIVFDAMNTDDGDFEACGRLKEREQTANIQILLISDLEYLEENYELFELWYDDFLIRPINVNELRIRVNTLLKKKSYLDTIPEDSEDSVRSAITDRTSGLANFPYFKHFLEHELKRYARDPKPVSLMMMEIIDGNQPSNSLEYSDGARLLKDLGTIIKENIRDIDLGARCIENKLAVVLANTDEIGVKIVARRLNDLILNHLSKGTEKSSTEWAIRYGSAVYPTDAEATDALIDQAEKMLIASQHQSSEIEKCA